MGFFDKKEKIDPFFKDDNWNSPVIFNDTSINDQHHFAILKTTGGGKYIRGNMLYYSLNGVEIYTDINNIIFVDTLNNTLFIRESKKVIDEIAPEDPEQKQYIMLYCDLGYENSENEFPFRWEAVTGRTEAYENIKCNAAVIDIDASIVLVESVTIKDSLTVRQFVQYLQNSNIVSTESFDINDYTGSEYI